MLVQDLQESDLQARAAAIDPTRSFIIQAPAGSGKTEILAQRFLNLLAHAVENPEEIIAITFTRKAAGEMRERVMSALEFAAHQPEPLEAHKRITWALAKKVLQVNQKKQWQLLSNPNRLRILTIDALCAMLSTQIPLLSGFGLRPEIIADANRYYQQAIFQVLQNPEQWQGAIEKLLLHLDNNAMQLAKLVTALLGKREQWLPYIYLSHRTQDLREFLQCSLRNITQEILLNAAYAFKAHNPELILHLARVAAEALVLTDPHHPICAWHNLKNFPTADIEYLTQWRGLAELLLTQKGEWRKKVDKNTGFAPDKKQEKQLMQNLLNELSRHDHLRQALLEITFCPPIAYSEKQWEIIDALLNLLPRIVAELQILFRQQGGMDFIELTLGALRALGDENQPTDLALYLDYQIRHVLVDEFQDTAVMQFNLLRKLIREWLPQEGKTLFLVGDPMQSIYRFRNAEVGLFLQAQHNPIENIKLNSIQLKQNFRSQANLVDWFNHTFSSIFPPEVDMLRGRVPYSLALAAKNSERNPAVTYQAFALENNDLYLQTLLMSIQSLLQQNPDDSIAILVRSRSHLNEIIPALNTAKLTYQAVELETLNHRPEITDLITLTKALLHLGDRIMWLALLRAPWSGLLLNDLYILCEYAEERPVWTALSHYEQIEGLSSDGKKRLAFIVPILTQALYTQARKPLALWIKQIWLQLRAPQYLTDNIQRENAECYFNLLEEIQYEFTFELLDQKIQRLYATTGNQSAAQIQIMTIHKSKGLEFDHVILPELQRAAPADENQLLMLLEKPNRNGENDLVFAPIKASYEAEDSIHVYLKRLESEKLSYEAARVFYVATTRAKKSLHLYCRLSLDNTDIKPPTKSSFLALIWDQYQHFFLQNFQQQRLSQIQDIPIKTPDLYRLPSQSFEINWEIPNMSFGFNNKVTALTDIIPTAFGSIMHEALQQAISTPTISALHWTKRLRQLGVEPHLAERLSKKVEHAVEMTLQDKRGQWILKPHNEAQSEYALTLARDGKYQRYVIDRTFIDENHYRWIIDFKAAVPAEESLANFLQRQKLEYCQQLENYAEVFLLLKTHPIKLGLYFPLCQGWIEWDYPAS